MESICTSLTGVGECLWVRIRGEGGEGDITVGLGYRQHGRGEEVESAPHNNFFKQFKEVSGLHTLFVWVFSHET